MRRHVRQLAVVFAFLSVASAVNDSIVVDRKHDFGGSKFPSSDPTVMKIELKSEDAEKIKNGQVEEIKITRKVPVPVPVTVEKRVPVAVPVPVDQPFPVYIPKPVPYAVHKPVIYPVPVGKTYGGDQKPLPKLPQPHLKLPQPPPKLPIVNPSLFNPLTNSPLGLLRNLVNVFKAKLKRIALAGKVPYHLPPPKPVVKHVPVPYPVEKVVPLQVEVKVPVPFKVKEYVPVSFHSDSDPLKNHAASTDGGTFGGEHGSSDFRASHDINIREFQSANPTFNNVDEVHNSFRDSFNYALNDGPGQVPHGSTHGIPEFTPLPDSNHFYESHKDSHLYSSPEKSTSNFEYLPNRLSDDSAHENSILTNQNAYESAVYLTAPQQKDAAHPVYDQQTVQHLSPSVTNHDAEPSRPNVLYQPSFEQEKYSSAQPYVSTEQSSHSQHEGQPSYEYHIFASSRPQSYFDDARLVQHTRPSYTHENYPSLQPEPTFNSNLLYDRLPFSLRESYSSPHPPTVSDRIRLEEHMRPYDVEYVLSPQNNFTLPNPYNRLRYQLTTVRAPQSHIAYVPYRLNRFNGYSMSEQPFKHPTTIAPSNYKGGQHYHLHVEMPAVDADTIKKQHYSEARPQYMYYLPRTENGPTETIHYGTPKATEYPANYVDANAARNQDYGQRNQIESYSTFEPREAFSPFAESNGTYQIKYEGGFLPSYPDATRMKIESRGIDLAPLSDLYDRTDRSKNSSTPDVASSISVRGPIREQKRFDGHVDSIDPFQYVRYAPAVRPVKEHSFVYAAPTESSVPVASDRSLTIEDYVAALSYTKAIHPQPVQHQSFTNGH